jgi:hypothetical protein
MTAMGGEDDAIGPSGRHDASSRGCPDGRRETKLFSR